MFSAKNNDHDDCNCFYYRSFGDLDMCVKNEFMF